MQIMNVCIDCGNEWEEDNATMCTKCKSGNFDTIVEDDYYNLSLENCLNLYNNKQLACVCDGDNKKILICEEDI